MGLTQSKNKITPFITDSIFEHTCIVYKNYCYHTIDITLANKKIKRCQLCNTISYSKI